MFRRFSANFAVFSMLLDAALVAAMLFLSASIRYALNEWSFVKEVLAPVVLPWGLYLAFPIIWVGVLLLFSVYDGRRNLRVVDEFGSLTLGSILSAVAMAGILYFSYRETSRFLFLLFVVTTWLAMLVWRGVVRLAFRRQWSRNLQRRRVLILGAGVVGRRLEQQIQQQPFLGLEITGFLDDSPTKQSAPGVLGHLDQVRDIVQQKSIEDIIIALPLSAYQRLNQMVSILHDLPVRVWVIPDYFSLTMHRAAVEDFAGIPMLDLRAPALSEYQRMIKRAFDLFICVIGFPFALVAMGLVALAIRLEGPGPIFYCPLRVGENGRLFRMFKFRTMIVGADKLQSQVTKKDAQGHEIHKIPDDPRVTRVGRFLRRKSLDELPQILNVVRGEMSLVGPRPEMPELVDKYEPWQRKRFVVPQGMTGWWQVNGRSDRPMHLHTEDDLYYVQHYSIWLDLQILVRTVWVALRGKGAF
ncbi:MAG TPA: sugar transferase [Anaerolineaceae bacterium]|nr:sugar transferase [Anaerolineaceae bacterium]HNS36463.1 sugar transferase [Anaerolineaceae bacterium]HQF61005.1 sugar transferase [Anaerolineaceae bacterium]HQH85063.1 sugar transferase [Anaerolineaceae bacterium]HQN44346.1 sugar transferase [Anaerolineaceae bacterium]